MAFQKFILPSDEVLDVEHLAHFIAEHQRRLPRYERLKALYSGNHIIFQSPPKERFKPDNRLVVNFAKYIVDTINGFFIGVPIKTQHDDEEIAQAVEFIQQYTNQDNVNAELAKLCSIYGHAYELLYLDENAEASTAYIDPREAFIIYDESIVSRPRYGVRYYRNSKGRLEGSFSDARSVYYFIYGDKGYQITEERPHYFDGVPMIEYVENEERTGAFEPVESLINAYNKALSEKANDVDYYADAYLKILGADLDHDTLNTLRDNRIINMSGGDSEKIVVDFLAKPEADKTQENLIDRLERLIYQMSMVTNINDENFGNSSGVAMRYKLQSMGNLANVKESKFKTSMTARWRMLMSLPNSKTPKDAWMGLSYVFTRNIPSNLAEEAQIAGQLSGIVSEETQLKVLSVVDNVKEEIARKDKEQDAKLNEQFSDLQMESVNA